MFKYLSQFSFKGNNYYLYKRASHMYISNTDLGKEVESSKDLSPIPANTELSDFIKTL